MKAISINVKSFTPEMKKLANELTNYDDEFGSVGRFLLYNDYISYGNIILLNDSEEDFTIGESLDRLSRAKNAYLLEDDCVIIMSEKDIISLLTKINKQEKIDYEEREEEEKEYKIRNATYTLESLGYKISPPETAAVKKTSRSK